MTPKQILREAHEIVKRNHCAIQLAVDERGVKVKNPRSPRAAAWSTVGALIKVAPRYPNVVADDAAPGHLGTAWEAFELLEAAAFDQGHLRDGTGSTVVCDQAGPEAVYLMFLRALDLAPADEPRHPHRAAVGTGALPRGVEAA